MQSARDSPLLYRALLRGPKVNGPSCDQTLLGTPVPVAHSTASQKTQKDKHRTFVLQREDMVALAAIGSNQSPVASPIQRIGSKFQEDGETSILNINSMAGLSGSVLDPSINAKGHSKIPVRAPTEKTLEKPLQAHFCKAPSDPESQALLSIEEAEAENREIEIDQAELKLLEDAFGDLDGVASEAEYTVPTKACATSTLDDGAGQDEEGVANKSGTTISSLASNSLTSSSQFGEKECAQPKNTNSEEQFSSEKLSSKSGLNKPQIDSEHVPSTSASAPEPPTYQIPMTTPLNPPPKRFSNLPCLTGLSSTLDGDLSTTHLSPDRLLSRNSPLHSTNSSLRPSLQTDKLIVPAPDQMAYSSLRGKAAVTDLSAPTNAHPAQVFNDYQNKLALQPSAVVQQSKDVHTSDTIRPTPANPALINISKSEDQQATTMFPKPINNPTEKREHLDETSLLLSRLHLSDVDGLLDMVHRPSEAGEDKENRPLDVVNKSNRVGPRLSTLQRVLRPTSNMSPIVVAGRRFTDLPTASRRTLSATTENISHGVDKPRITEEQNTPPPTLDRIPVTSSSLVGTKQRDTVPIADTEAVSPVLKELQSAHDRKATDVLSKTNSSKTVAQSLQKEPAGTPSALLSNTNCLVFCGAVCGQIQHQHLLIKHQLPKPVTLRLLVSPGGDVFKLTDERGYLLTGPHSVCIPPGLEYPVHVAYVARQPLTWDTGQLQLSIEDSNQSTWKVRLIGYSSSSQLECCCCTRLNSEIYWTTATRLSERKASRKSIGSESMTVHHTSSTRANTVEPAKGTSIACVVLTNFGLRAAWVLCNAESSESSRRDLSSDKPGELPQPISVEPSRLVIGPRQSQNIVITVQPGVDSARVTFFYGDEVLRHQVRQHFIRPPKSSSRRRIGRHVKVIDLMEDFKNEVPFQITEMPPRLRHPVRPDDWYQALSKQLHLREHFVLNVYSTASSNEVDTTESLNEQQTTPDSSPTLTSIVVKEDAFDSRKSSRHYSSPRHQKRQNYPEPRVRSSLISTHVLRLQPEDTLVFPACHPGDTSQAEFQLCLDDRLSDNRAKLWRVECTLKALSEATQDPEGNFSTQDRCSQQLNGSDVFVCLLPPSTKNQRPEEYTVRGLLTLENVNPELKLLRIPFEFHAPSAEAAYHQRWKLTVWAQPCTQTDSKTNLDFVKVDTTGPDSVNSKFHVTLKGQCLAPTRQPGGSTPVVDSICTKEPGESTGHNEPNTISPKSPAPSQLVPLRRHGRKHKLGPLLIEGIPVIFSPVDSESEEYVSTYQLELLNCMQSNTVFVQLELPKPPFHLVKPTQTRFRIIPKRWVHLQLAYRPTESGSAKSILGIQTMALPDGDPEAAVLRSCNSEVYKTEIPLVGFMR